MTIMVRCEDGVCYPCNVLGIVTDYTHYLPKMEIEFIGVRPEFIIVKKILVNVHQLVDSGRESTMELIRAARKINLNSPVIRRLF